VCVARTYVVVIYSAMYRRPNLNNRPAEMSQEVDDQMHRTLAAEDGFLPDGLEGKLLLQVFAHMRGRKGTMQK
jgi:hypothetical protein